MNDSSLADRDLLSGADEMFNAADHSASGYGGGSSSLDTRRWSASKANRWYARQPWLIGANYVPASASNQLDMWQADSFALHEIDRELGWAAALGMNTMRVFLTDLLWESDREGFAQRIDDFLGVCARHGIRPMLVLFDSCWNAAPELGPQATPQAGVHNAGWLQVPGQIALLDRDAWPRLRDYVEGVVARFANDRRILAWDIWNEPCNPGNPHRPNDLAQAKFDAVAALLPQVFAWARGQGPVQPLTCGLWQHDDWSPNARLTSVEAMQLTLSDLVSFHDYGNVDQFAGRVAQLQAWGRPVLCTEWLARSTGSTIDAILPTARRLNVGMINWGLVSGRTQTTLPWDSWLTPYASEPERWFHDLLRPDGTPYCAVEAAMILALAKLDCPLPQARAAASRTASYGATVPDRAPRRPSARRPASP